MLFQRRKSQDDSNVVNACPKQQQQPQNQQPKRKGKKKKQRARKIDASKPLDELLEDHLYSMWCATPLNLEVDERGRLCGYVHSDFHIQFSFPNNDQFVMAIVLRAPSTERTIHVCSDTGLPACMEILEEPIHNSRGLHRVVLLNQVSVASLLFDEDMEQTMEQFLDMARHIQTELRKDQPPASQRRDETPRRKSSRIRSLFVKKQPQQDQRR